MFTLDSDTAEVISDCISRCVAADIMEEYCAPRLACEAFLTEYPASTATYGGFIRAVEAHHFVQGMILLSFFGGLGFLRTQFDAETNHEQLRVALQDKTYCTKLVRIFISELPLSDEQDALLASEDRITDMRDSSPWQGLVSG